MASLSEGQEAEITFPALSGETAKGEVSSISPTATVSNNVVTYTGIITLTDTPDGIRLGQSATATVTTASATDVLYVPTQALNTSDGGGYTVTVVDDSGNQTDVAVEIGTEGDSSVEITSGLSEGDEVVISTDTGVTESDDSSSDTGGMNGGMNGGMTGGGGGMPAGGGPGGF